MTLKPVVDFVRSVIPPQADTFSEPVTIQIHYHVTDEVDSVKWDWDEELGPKGKRDLFTSLQEGGGGQGVI